MSESLAALAIKSLKKNLSRVVVVDRTGLQRHVLRAGKLLALAGTLAKSLRLREDERIGVVLPPCAWSYIVNLAIAIAGKSSVNLNFTASRETIEKNIAAAGISLVLTVPAMKEKLGDGFPWTKEVWQLTEFFEQHRPRYVKRLMQTLLLPPEILTWRWHGEKKPEATLLFSSGSTGKPKGVPLSDGNIAANLEQIEELELLPDGLRLLASLPFFHSFGLTVNLWYPLTHAVEAVTYPNPLDATGIAEIARSEQVHALIGSASFFRYYLKQIKREDLASLRYVVAGAEKTPKGLHERWKETFGSDYLEGYGLTETSPVVSVNKPGANRIGTVGRPLMGIEARIVDVETREVLTHPRTQGILEVKGENVFGGYLDDEKASHEIFHDGWLSTGDLGHIDAEGYLVIEGRLRRFSKIAGEMVPHGEIEEAIAKVFGWQDEAMLPVVLTGVPDEAKGETLVLLSEKPIDAEELRKKLSASGAPNLWIPKKIVQVDAVPRLPSGKLDLMRVRELAGGK